MSRLTQGLALACVAAFSLATAAQAQQAPETGVYVVGRIGGSITPKQKLDLNDVSASFPDDAKYKTGITGEIGAGYSFGRFRVEQTIGYASNDLKSGDLESNGFSGDGRARSLSVMVGGYFDIPVTDRIVPYVGGAVGVARVQTRLSAVDDLTGSASGFDGKDWGLAWHADAGVGVRMTEKMMLELGLRYGQISNLKYSGVNAGLDAQFQPKLSSASATVGVRYAF